MVIFWQKSFRILLVLSNFSWVSSRFACVILWSMFSLTWSYYLFAQYFFCVSKQISSISLRSWSSPNSYAYSPWLTYVFLRERFFTRAAEHIFLTRAITYLLFGTNFSLSWRRRQKRALLILSNYRQYLNIILSSH